MTDAGAVARASRRSARRARALRDPQRPHGSGGERRAAWDGYVGATRNVVDAGRRRPGRADLDRLGVRRHAGRRDRGRAAQPDQRLRLPEGGVGAGGHRARTARRGRAHLRRAGRGAAGRASQDHGFGYFVASLVERAARRRAVHGLGGEDINMRATPTLASDVGELMWRMLERERTGIHHCCGGESVTRAELARATVRAFDLDGVAAALRPSASARRPGPVRHEHRRHRDRPRARRRTARRRRPAHAPAGAAAVMKLAGGRAGGDLRPRGRDGLPLAAPPRRGAARPARRRSRPTRAPARRWASRCCTRGRTGSARGRYDALGEHVDLTARRCAPTPGPGLPMHGTLPRPWTRARTRRGAELDGASDAAFPFAHTVRLEADARATRCGSRPRSRPTTGPVPVELRLPPVPADPGRAARASGTSSCR